MIRSKKAEKTEYDPIYINPDLGVQLRDYIKVHDYKQMESVFGGGENKRDPPEDNGATDTIGDIAAAALVPQLVAGTHSVLITVSGVTANTSVSILE